MDTALAERKLTLLDNAVPTWLVILFSEAGRARKGIMSADCLCTGLSLLKHTLHWKKTYLQVYNNQCHSH